MNIVVLAEKKNYRGTLLMFTLTKWTNKGTRIQTRRFLVISINKFRIIDFK